MEQRLSLITLGVADLPRAVEFYAALGWEPGNEWREQDVAFFQCPGMVFALWNRDELAADSGTEANPPGAATLAWNAQSPAEVDAALEEARAAGAKIVREGADTPWGGYSGCFHDLDGHAWELAHNPFWRIAADGSTNLQ